MSGFVPRLRSARIGRQLLGQLPEVAVGIFEVSSAETPFTVDRLSDELDSVRDQMFIESVHVVDKRDELGTGTSWRTSGDCLLR